MLACDVVFRQFEGQQSHGLIGLHGVDVVDADFIRGFVRQRGTDAGGHQHGGVGGIHQKRFEVRASPCIIDHQQHVAVADGGAEFVAGGFQCLDRGTLSAQFDHQIEQKLDAHLFADGLSERDPERAVKVGRPHALVMADDTGEGGLAVSACTFERDQPVGRILQAGDDRLDDIRAGDVIERGGFHHERDFLRCVGCVQIMDKAPPDQVAFRLAVAEVLHVGELHPAWQGVEVDVVHDDRNHTGADLSSVKPFLRHDLGLQRGR